MVTYSFFQLAQNHIIQGLSVSDLRTSNGFLSPPLDILLFDITVVLWILVSVSVANYLSRIMKDRSLSFVSYVAFASYAVFLFHQFYMSILGLFFRNMAHLGDIEIFALALFPGIPILIVLCFQVQKQANELVDRVLTSVHSRIDRGHS
jgi:peptidoglycan/LPS O-acetylase OafA/YrhL